MSDTKRLIDRFAAYLLEVEAPAQEIVLRYRATHGENALTIAVMDLENMRSGDDPQVDTFGIGPDIVAIGLEESYRRFRICEMARAVELLRKQAKQ